MKITDADRELASEILDALGIEDDERTRKVLAVVLWAHRQRPADDAELVWHAPDRPGSEPELCGAVSPMTCQFCVLAAGHPVPAEYSHRTVEGTWF